ncbi:MAG TPA: hypothetical protein DDY17_06315 [Syntrophaceae bacterium]|nr:hypothetical protein [Syntrophaceae bacterium]
MRKRVLMFSCVVVCFGILIGGLSDTHAQSLPDLVVTKLACVAGEGRLQITVANKSIAALPIYANPMADVYFGAMKVGIVNLKSPTSGSILKANGVATYLTYFVIPSTIAVKVVVDPLKTIKESNELNNSLTQTLAACMSQVNLDYQIK